MNNYSLIELVHELRLYYPNAGWRFNSMKGELIVLSDGTGSEVLARGQHLVPLFQEAIHKAKLLKGRAVRVTYK